MIHQPDPNPMGSSITSSFLTKWDRLRNRIYTALLSGSFARCARGSRISPPLRFSNLHQVSLAESVIIHSDCWIGVVSSPDSDNSVRLTVGPHSAIGMGATISAAESIVLEEHVLLARNVYISDHGHAYEDISRPIMAQGISRPAPVRIGRHTWLGQNVVVLPGVTIGEHCVIGANSVVRNSIPAFSVAVGIPARVVKTYNKETSRWDKPAGGTA